MTVAEPLPRPADAAGLDRDNPWPGLASFTETQAAFFHGRERESSDLLEVVRTAGLSVLFGQSGLGKSSLLRAGLFPRLRRNNFLPVMFRIGYGDAGPEPPEQIRLALAAAVVESGVDAPPPRPGESLWEYFHRRDVDFWSPRNQPVTPVLVFDQFEELFTLGRSTEVARAHGRLLVEEVSQLVENRPPPRLRKQFESDEAAPSAFAFDRTGCRVLLSLREDFLADLEGLRPMFRSILLNRMRLEPMTGEQAMEVIDRPGGHLVEPGVTARIVRFVAAAEGSDAAAGGTGPPSAVTDETGPDRSRHDSAAEDASLSRGPVEPRAGGGEGSSSDGVLSTLLVEPALLSIVCRELNNRRRDRGLERITSDLLAGTRQSILADFYERGVSDVPPAARRFVEDRLLTRSGFRNSIAWEDAVIGGTESGDTGGEEAPGLTRDALDLLVGRRLLRVEERLGSRRVELTHDALAEPVRASRDVRRQRELLAAAGEKSRRAAAAARRKRVLVFSFVVGTLFVGSLSVVTVFALRQESRAEKNALEAMRQKSIAEENADKARQQRELADRSGSKVRHQLVDVYVRQGWTRIDAGDPSVALLWFAKALENALGDPLLEDDARVRFATALASAPRLLDSSPVPAPAAGSTPPTRMLRKSDKTVEILDSNTGRRLTPPLESDDLFTSATLSSDGQWVFTSSKGKSSNGDNVQEDTARLWDASTGKPLTASLPQGSRVTSAAFSPDGTRVVTACADRTARVWDAATGKPVGDAMRHEDKVISAAFSPDGTRVVTACADRTARVWDAATGKPVGDAMRPSDELFSAAFSPDGTRVVTACADRTVWEWELKQEEPESDAPKWELLAGPMRHEDAIRSAAFSADGRWLIVHGVDGETLRVWDSSTGSPLTPPLRDGDTDRSVGFSRDDRRCVVAGSDHTARVWETSTRQILTPPLWQESTVASARFSPDGQRLTTVSNGGSTRAWAVDSKGPAVPAKWFDVRVVHAAFSEDARRVITAGMDNAGRVRDVETGKQLTPPLPHDDVVLSVAFSPDGLRVATASLDHTARVWDAVSGKPVTPPLLHRQTVISVAFSRDGLRVVTASLDNTARVWDAGTGQPLTPPLRHGDTVWSAAFNGDGRRVVTASSDGTARVWDVETGQPLGEPLRHAREVDSATPVPDDPTGGSEKPYEPAPTVVSASFSPDGSRVVTSSDDRSARVWDVSTGNPVTPPLRHENTVWAATFSRDGRRVVTASDDGTARVWNATTGEPITPPLRHSGRVVFAGFNPDNRRIATASDDGTARVWDAETGTPLTPALNLGQTVISVAFSPDGRRAAIAGTAGVTRAWDLTPDPRPAEHLKSLAELLAVQNLDSTDALVPLKAEEWNTRWDDLRKRYPGQFSPQSQATPPTGPDDKAATRPATIPATRPAGPQ